MLDTAEDLGGTFFTALGGNEDYTVSTAGTVEGSSRGVFQDRETLDIIGTQTVKVCRGQFDVIDKNESGLDPPSPKVVTPRTKKSVLS